MRSSLTQKNILLGITGSIAAYKSADLIRRLREQNAHVRVAMTENAKRFITPLTLQAVSGFPVHDDLFDVEAEAAMGHIELARWADAILVAPASADFMARLARGMANDLLTTLVLATKAPIALAPAMNQGMWQHVLTQDNLRCLKKLGVTIIGPGIGSQACGDSGPGRMSEPEEIVKSLAQLFASDELAGVNVLITAGPTHEALDPIRYISNKSSGKMGYALAKAAHDAGANVTLISGPTHLKKPEDIDTIAVQSAVEMQEAVLKHLAACDIFISVAAVSDYRPVQSQQHKMPKEKQDFELPLTLNPDIVASVAKHKSRPTLVVAFAAETQNLIARAKQKLTEKAVDLVIANDVSQAMNADHNEVTVVMPHEEIFFPTNTKDKLARQLIQVLAKHYQSKKI